MLSGVNYNPYSGANYSSGFLKKRPVSASKVSFEGLRSAIGKQLFPSGREVIELHNLYPKSNAIVGNLPPSWIQLIPQKARKELIKELYSAFAEAAVLLRKNQYQINKERYIKESAEKVTQALKKAGVLNPDSSIKFDKLGQGKYGAGYSFKVNDETFVFKVFHTKAKPNNEYHGELVETNRAEFIDRNTENSQFGKFYFADIENAYNVFKFIDSSVPKPEKSVDLRGLGFSYGDDGEEKIGLNIINDYICDYGGISITNKILASNKTARWVYKKITQNTDESKWSAKWNKLHEIAVANHVPNTKDILLGLVAFVDYLPENKRSEFLIKLAKTEQIDNRVRQAILNYRDTADILSPEDRYKIFEALVHNSSDQFKLELADSVKNLSNDHKLKAFKALAQFDNQKLKLKLVDGMSYISYANRVEMIKILSVGADEELKEKLNEQMNYIPDKYLGDLKEIL